MSEDRKLASSEEKRPIPFTEEKGLQPAKNPPPMPQVKPPKSEKKS
ncbi:MAG: hypothetical protein HQK65_06950 [Desulfamplus sp.]|nr:hypothetical protein [Desulfamplus sp.]